MHEPEPGDGSPVDAPAQPGHVARHASAADTPRGPRALNPGVSRQMSRMPTRDSLAEVALRRELHQRGLRFRLQGRLPGRPDILLTKARVAIFVDGCYWHACPQHGTLPTNNREWWRAKFEATVARDRRKDEQLRKLGWLPVHVWEHEDAGTAADALTALWRVRTVRARVVTPLSDPRENLVQVGVVPAGS